MLLVFVPLSASLALAVPNEKLRQVEAERIAAMDRVRGSVIAIFSADGGGGGSGVIISGDGYALSNFHVTKPSGDAMKCGLPDGTYVDAVVVGLDPTGDVALIKLLGRDSYSFAELGDSDQVRAGQSVFAMGNPFLLATDFQPTVTFGIVSGVHRYQYPAGTILEYADCLQTDASINPGNSGGPLFNLRGELIGINGRGSFEKRGRVNVGVAYAISINQIKNFLGHLKGGRVVDHASLGAVVGSDPDGRVIVTDILEESDAYRRGLRYGDEIISFAGRPIRTVNAFKNALGILPKGWRVPLELRRNGKTEQILVRLAGVHSEADLREAVTGPGIPDPDKPRDPEPDKERPPKENDKDRDKQNGDEKQPQHHTPGLKLPHPRHDMPEIVKQHFEARPGYANYYFNKLAQERVFKALLSHGDFSKSTGVWSLRGELVTHGDVEFELSDKAVRAVLPGGPLRLEFNEDLSDDRDPPDSGGLLAALALWRRFLTLGMAGFDELYYLGTAPLAAGPPVDVLVALGFGVETRLYVDAAAGRLLALELYPAQDQEDPCEVYFRSWQTVEGRDLPAEIEVRFADETYGIFHFTQFRLASGDQP
jgi:S1-C subfamily serine protease